MVGERRNMPFSEAVLINPRVLLERGKTYPFVGMSTVNAGFRCAHAIEQRKYSGGGSRFRTGDTLMARIAPCLENGKIARYCALDTSEPAHGSTEFIVIRVRTNVTDTEFCYYLTQWEEVRSYVIGQMTGTSGRQRVPTESLNYLTVPVPPLPDQRAIAHILGTLDDKIELNRRMNETLEAMARALFKSWFVDFDPVRAKMAGRDTGLPKHLADLFPDRLVESELGMIPEGWKVRPLGDLVETVKGRSYKSKELIESETALVTLKSFARGGGYRPEGLKSFSGTYKSDQVVDPGEIVIACTDVTQAADVIGRPAIVKTAATYRTLVASLDTLIVRPSHQGMTRAFLYFLAGNDEFVAHTYAHTTGTTVLHLAKEAVPSFRFPQPPTLLIHSFDDVARPALERIQTSQQESTPLATIRNTLLPKLISGEVRVKDAETFLERAL